MKLLIAISFSITTTVIMYSITDLLHITEKMHFLVGWQSCVMFYIGLDLK